MMRGGYGFDEDDFEWDFIESDLESSEDVTRLSVGQAFVLDLNVAFFFVCVCVF